MKKLKFLNTQLLKQLKICNPYIRKMNTKKISEGKQASNDFLVKKNLNNIFQICESFNLPLFLFLVHFLRQGLMF